MPNCEFPKCHEAARVRVAFKLDDYHGWRLACWAHRAIWPEDGWEPRAMYKLDGTPMMEPKRIELARQFLGFDREAYARLLGTDEYTVWRIEREDLDVTDTLAQAILTIGHREFRPSFFFAPMLISFDIGETSMKFHTPLRQLCQDCSSRPSTALCDYTASGSRRSCSRRLCDVCRTRRGPTIDLCKEHNAVLA